MRSDYLVKTKRENLPSRQKIAGFDLPCGSMAALWHPKKAYATDCDATSCRVQTDDCVYEPNNGNGFIVFGVGNPRQKLGNLRKVSTLRKLFLNC